MSTPREHLVLRGIISVGVVAALTANLAGFGVLSYALSLWTSLLWVWEHDIEDRIERSLHADHDGHDRDGDGHHDDHHHRGSPSGAAVRG
jgi:hypothetical protein